MKKHNDLDRDIAKGINSILSECLTLVNHINDNKFVPHITRQPVDFTGALTEIATFHVDANNVKKYQWQYASPNTPDNWRVPQSIEGNTTDTISFRINTTLAPLLFRCEITGKDNSVIYSNVVHVILTT